MTMTENHTNTVIGTRMLRREDPALLTGEGKYTNDLNIPGALHLAVLRSPSRTQRSSASTPPPQRRCQVLLRCTQAPNLPPNGQALCHARGQ